MFPKSKAYNEGYKANEDGLPLDACPYVMISNTAREWIRGWYDAEEDNETVSYRELSYGLYEDLENDEI